jgi:hypothetical protein
MFPNPANESVYLDLSQITDLAFTLDLFAMDGKLVLSRKINQQESLKNYNIPLANLPSGIYTVKVSSSLGEFSRQLTVN